MLPVIEKALFSPIQIEQSRDKCQGHKSARPRAICPSPASPVTRSAALQKSKVGTRTWVPDCLEPSAPDGQAGRPCPPEASGCPGWHGVGRAGTVCPGSGDFLVPGWSRVHQGDGRGAAGAGPPVTSVSVCALFVVSKFSAMNTKYNHLCWQPKNILQPAVKPALGQIRVALPLCVLSLAPGVALGAWGRELGGAGGQRCSPDLPGPGDLPVPACCVRFARMCASFTSGL